MPVLDNWNPQSYQPVTFQAPQQYGANWQSYQQQYTNASYQNPPPPLPVVANPDPMQQPLL